MRNEWANTTLQTSKVSDITRFIVNSYSPSWHNSSSFNQTVYIMNSDNITNGVKRQDDECAIPSTNGDVTNKSTMTDTAMSSPLTKFLPKPQKVKDDYVYP